MRRLHLLVPLAIALALSMPSAASAAGVLEYQIQYSPATADGRAMAIVNASLDPQTPLPATVQVPVPADATVLWAGEVMRTDSSPDVERPTTVERAGDMDVYSLTLEQSYTAQLEVQLPAPSLKGSKLTSSMRWTNPGEDVLVLGSVVVEPGAEQVKTEPASSGSIKKNDAGESLYPLAGLRVPKGGSYTIQVEWTKSGGAAAPKNQSVPPLLLIALFAAVVTLVAVVVSQRTRARRSEGHEG